MANLLRVPKIRTARTLIQGLRCPHCDYIWRPRERKHKSRRPRCPSCTRDLAANGNNT